MDEEEEEDDEKWKKKKKGYGVLKERKLNHLLFFFLFQGVMCERTEEKMVFTCVGLLYEKER